MRTVFLPQRFGQRVIGRKRQWIAKAAGGAVFEILIKAKQGVALGWPLQQSLTGAQGQADHQEGCQEADQDCAAIPWRRQNQKQAKPNQSQKTDPKAQKQKSGRAKKLNGQRHTRQLRQPRQPLLGSVVRRLLRHRQLFFRHAQKSLAKRDLFLARRLQTRHKKERGIRASSAIDRARSGFQSFRADV